MAKNLSLAAEGRAAAAGLWKTFLASTVVLALGLIVLFQATAQGNAFTTETLRRTEVANTPSLVPELSVYDADGNQSTLRQLLADGDRRHQPEVRQPRHLLIALLGASAAHGSPYE